jgi:hypothetical protein
MDHTMKPLAGDPRRLHGLPEKLIVGMARKTSREVRSGSR